MKTESATDYDDRMRRLAAGYESMPSAKRSIMESIPGWREQMQEALDYVTSYPDPLPKPVTIDLTPSWAALMPLLIELLASQNHSARGNARAELMRLAAAVDRMNAQAKAKANTGA